METVIMHPESKEQLSALKAIAKALNVKFETSPYNPEFVKKIKASKKEVEEGKFITLDPDKTLWQNLG
jgi:predicted adenine nucleotide alpha hydrolase (AANH) superfamily ATPase